MTPVYPLCDASDGHVFPSGRLGYAGVTLALQATETDSLNLVGRHDSGVGGSAANSVENVPTVFEVFQLGAPFQVFGPVVEFVPVDVVNIALIGFDAVKCAGNKPMHLALDATAFAGQIPLRSNLPALSDHDAHVAMKVEAPLKDASGSTNPAKCASFVAGIFGDCFPVFHDAGYADVNSIRKH